ncbi:serine/threonine protein kinase [Mumia sp. ZJ1417]|nr:serine/threonine protein kinase [Mumia sp. ZJ1417]
MKQLGRYRLVRVLGSGAFATVWLGEDPNLEAHVAVKVLADNWVHNADVRERFLTEARLLRRVDDPRVVRVFDIGVSDDRPYIVMEYVPGGTLADRMDGLDSRQALAYGVEAARALHVLHEAGVVHRDVKPSNLLVDDRTTPPRLLVSDLGSAKVLAEASGLTVTTGTPLYMAPEQAHQSDGFDARADVYAVAAVTYHLLSGRPPYDDSTAAAVVARRPDTKPAPIAAAVDLPAELDPLLARALSWEPSKRPASAAALADALERIASEDRPTRVRREVPTILVLVLCVVLFLAAFAITYLLMR